MVSPYAFLYRLYTEYILSGHVDGSLAMYRLSDSIQLWNTKPHSTTVLAISVSSPLLVSAAADSVCIYRLTNDLTVVPSPIQTILPRHLVTAAFLTEMNESKLLILADTTCQLLVYCEDEATGTFKVVAAMTGHQDWIKSVYAHSIPSGPRKGQLLIASASLDKFVRVWGISPAHEFLPQRNEGDEFDAGVSTKSCPFSIQRNGQEYKFVFYFDALLMAHEDWVQGVFIHPTETSLDILSASADKTIIIWKETDGLYLPAHRFGQVGGVYGMSMNSVLQSQDRLYSASHSGTIYAWYMKDGKWVSDLPITGHQGDVRDIQWMENGGLMSTSADKTTRIFAECKLHEGEREWKEIARPQVHGFALTSLSMLDDGFVSGAEEKILRVFETPSTFYKTFENITGQPTQFKDDPENPKPIGSTLPALGLTNKPIFENPETTNQAGSERNKIAYTESFKFYPLSSPPAEANLHLGLLWPEVDKLYGHGNEIVATAIHRPSNLVLSSCRATKEEQACLLVWDAETWKLKQTLKGHSLTITNILVSENWVLSVSRDRSFILYKVEDRDVQIVCQVQKAHARILWDACFLGSSVFCTASRDKSIKVWDMQGNCLRTIAFNESVTAIESVQVSSEEYLLAVGLENGQVQIHRLNVPNFEFAFEKELPERHAAQVNALRWRKEESGRLLLASCSLDWSVRIIVV